MTIVTVSLTLSLRRRRPGLGLGPTQSRKSTPRGESQCRARQSNSTFRSSRVVMATVIGFKLPIPGLPGSLFKPTGPEPQRQCEGPIGPTYLFGPVVFYDCFLFVCAHLIDPQFVQKDDKVFHVPSKLNLTCRNHSSLINHVRLMQEPVWDTPRGVAWRMKSLLSLRKRLTQKPLYRLLSSPSLETCT